MGALRRDIRQHHPLERRSALGDRRERRADPAGSDHQDPHPLTTTTLISDHQGPHTTTGLSYALPILAEPIKTVPKRRQPSIETTAPPDRRRRRSRLALAAILLVGLSYATMFQTFSWNQTSHYDLIRALYHDTTTIDPYRSNTGDKVEYDGHWYSARAPGLALFTLPWYTVLEAVGADEWAWHAQAMRHDDELLDLTGLWANVLPGLLLLLLVWRAAERLQPGFGVAAAVTLGLGTMALGLSTLLFSHIFTACLGFAAFALLMRERDGAAEPVVRLGRGAADRLCVRLGVPAGVRRGRARGLPAVAARHPQIPVGPAAARRGLRARGAGRDRAAAALQPLRVSLLDAHRLRQRAPPETGLLRGRAPPACGCWRRCCWTPAAC